MHNGDNLKKSQQFRNKTKKKRRVLASLQLTVTTKPNPQANPSSYHETPRKYMIAQNALPKPRCHLHEPPKPGSARNQVNRKVQPLVLPRTAPGPQKRPQRDAFPQVSCFLLVRWPAGPASSQDSDVEGTGSGLPTSPYPPERRFTLQPPHWEAEEEPAPARRGPLGHRGVTGGVAPNRPRQPLPGAEAPSAALSARPPRAQGPRSASRAGAGRPAPRPGHPPAQGDLRACHLEGQGRGPVREQEGAGASAAHSQPPTRGAPGETRRPPLRSPSHTPAPGLGPNTATPPPPPARHEAATPHGLAHLPCSAAGPTAVRRAAGGGGRAKAPGHASRTTCCISHSYRGRGRRRWAAWAL